MFDFQKKRVLERIFYSRAAIGALAIMLLFVLNALWELYDKYLEAAENRDRAAEEYRAIGAQADMLRENLALLKTERGVEKKIREEFGFAKEGEGVVVIVDEDARADGPVAQKKNFLGTIWNSIRNIGG